MKYQLKYRDSLILNENPNIPHLTEESVMRDIIGKFVNELPIEELTALFNLKREVVNMVPYGKFIDFTLTFNSFEMGYIKEIEWANRYSNTSEPDEHGRWARIAYIGNKDNFGFCDDTRRRQFFELAWVSMVVVNEKRNFTVNYHFPCSSKRVFSTLEEAKEEVETAFKFFIKNVVK